MTEYTPPKVLINAENFRKVIFQLLLVAISIADLFPIYYVIVTSFKTHPEYLHNLFGPPISPTFDNFQQALIQGNLLLWFRNSVIMTVTTVTIVTLICSAAAFATSKMEFKGRKALLQILVSLMIMPPVVMIIPLFLLMVRVGLINNFLGVIIIYSGLLAPFSVYLLTAFSVPSRMKSWRRLRSTAARPSKFFAISYCHFPDRPLQPRWWLTGCGFGMS